MAMTLDSAIARMNECRAGCDVGDPFYADIEAWDVIRAHITQPAQAVDAWMTDDGRVISAKQKSTAIKDGGASASSVEPYNIPLTAALPTSPTDKDQR